MPLQTYFLKNDGVNVEITCEGELLYRWPTQGPYRNFTKHLLARLLSPQALYILFSSRTPTFAYACKDIFDVYLPPEYQRLNTKSLWHRFINLFKKEKQHVRSKNTRRVE